MRVTAQPPVVLVIAGNDPSGGAGLAADIQALTALGAHPAPVVAALTVQDSVDVTRVQTVEPALVVEQAERVLADMPVRAVKLGLLASAETGAAVAELLARHRGLPLVVDPVLAASGGGRLAEDALMDVYLKRLFPLASVATPNAAESRRLAPKAADAAARGAALLATGAAHVLLKGADEDTPDVANILFSRDGPREDFIWPRLPESYHGSGCTLASALAALLARGLPVPEAAREAQRYTWEALKRGYRPGRGQYVPDRRP